MYFKKILPKLLTLTTISSLWVPVAFAHPGHETVNNLLHGVLHTEHLLIILAIAVVAAIGAFLKQ